MLFDMTNIYNTKKTLMKGLRNETLTTITFKSKSRMIFCHIIDIWHLYKDGGTTQCSTLMFMLSPTLSPVASSNYINTYLNIALYQHLRLRHENAWMHEQHITSDWCLNLMNNLMEVLISAVKCQISFLYLPTGLPSRGLYRGAEKFF